MTRDLLAALLGAGLVVWGLVVIALGLPLPWIGPVIGGTFSLAYGIMRLFPEDRITPGDLPVATAELRGPRRAPLRIALELAAGIGLVLVAVDVANHAATGGALAGLDPLAIRVIASVGVVGGLALASLGLAHTVSALPALDLFGGMGGYRSFVAWRYLLVFRTKVTTLARAATALAVGFLLALGLAGSLDWLPGAVARQLAAVGFGWLTLVVFAGILRHSRATTVIFLLGAVLAAGALIGTQVFARGPVTGSYLVEEPNTRVLQALSIAQLVGFGLVGLAMFFGTIRAFFTFFTTVPIGGVWIGTAALVMVLAVMSGFETDLRDKILGSNAHIQVTRDDGEFVDWRAAKAKIDALPGVVASTPYAASEVVLAANNSGSSVIIKGIDPETVGRVTDLVSDLEDKASLQRLYPLAKIDNDLRVPQPAAGAGAGSGAGGSVLDPPPDDMPARGEPIDFSHGPAGDPAVRDPAPDDLLTSSDEPIDYSQPEDGDDAIEVIDLPFDPQADRRRNALPGVLVGRELVKQLHLYTDEEVRVVSPLSDPSNPDATGTPIPFNRDYRIAGVFYTGMYEYDLKYVYVTLESLQAFLDRGDTIDGIEVRITDPDDTGRFVPTETSPGLLRAALGPGYRILDWRELNRSLFSALKLEKIAMFLVLGIVILVASFSIVGNLIMVVIEKAKEIALLKTLGASDIGVMQLFAIQGLLIGAIGTVLGVGLGLLGCWAGKRFGLPLNPDVYYIDRLPIHVDPQSVVAAALAGVLISIAATLYPALLAARVRPAAGMRH